MDRQFYWISEQISAPTLPTSNFALEEPNGLLAAGGDLSIDTLLSAYRTGVFPWYSEGQPILWWTPTPRCVLYTDQLHVSRSLKKAIRSRDIVVSMDEAFPQVVDACSGYRSDQDGTWILPEMRDAYVAMHRVGFAHSVEAWQDGKLVGGLYGIAIGRMFYGESMFSAVRDASKIAFTYLVKQLEAWGFTLIDCQVETEHLRSLGATLISREHFEQALSDRVKLPNIHENWQISLTKEQLLSML